MLKKKDYFCDEKYIEEQNATLFIAALKGQSKCGRLKHQTGEVDLHNSEAIFFVVRSSDPSFQLFPSTE